MDGFAPRTLTRNLALAALVLAGFSGCQTLRFSHKPTMRNAEVTPPEAVSQTGAPPNAYIIEFRKQDGRIATMEQPLTTETHVQEALVKAGAFKRFSRVNLELVRSLPNGGQHRMGMEHSDYARRVEPEYDYALRPGDKIIVQEADESMLDDAMNGVLAPLGMDRAMQKFSSAPKSSKYQIRD